MKKVKTLKRRIALNATAILMISMGVLLLVLESAAVTQNQPITPPTPQTAAMPGTYNGITLQGWIYPDCPDALPAAQTHRPAIVKPEWYSFDSTGMLEMIIQTPETCNGFSEETLAALRGAS